MNFVDIIQSYLVSRRTLRRLTTHLAVPVRLLLSTLYRVKAIIGRIYEFSRSCAGPENYASESLAT